MTMRGGKGIFRAALAFVLLVLYISTMVAGDVMALTCGCCHDEADVHTAFRHVHRCVESGCGCDNHTAQCASPILKAHHECHHNHSTEVELYTHPRIDDSLLRQTILLAVLMDTSVEIESSENSLSFEYQEYSLPALSAGHIGALSQRAPPAVI